MGKLIKKGTKVQVHKRYPEKINKEKAHNGHARPNSFYAKSYELTSSIQQVINATQLQANNFKRSGTLVRTRWTKQEKRTKMT